MVKINNLCLQLFISLTVFFFNLNNNNLPSFNFIHYDNNYNISNKYNYIF